MSLKQRIQESLHRRQLAWYEAELERQKEGYRRKLSAEAIRIPEEEAFSQSIAGCRVINEKAFTDILGTMRALSYDLTDDMRGLAVRAGIEETVWVLVRGDGYADEETLGKIAGYFAENSQCEWAYPDEDVCTEEKELILPYLKPDYSPETLKSYNYIGNMLAFSASEAEALAVQDTDSEAEPTDLIYHVAAFMAGRRPAYHIREIAYHYCDREYTTDGRMYVGTRPVTYRYPVYEIPEKARIGILIPSKDHPEVLKRCVRSVREKSTFPDYEIIVVDNGSNAENKAVYEGLAGEYDFRYIYEPMEFHFSRMCNLAAKMSSGNYLVFLNDDTEVVTTDWLERMLSQAAQPLVGAVGAKLYYPDGDLIQHIGVTNMYEGPVHKLFGWSDAKDYDRGRNRGVRNVIGVTAACLMIERKRFEAVGGFPEELAVAYNDVDLCLSLCEHRYRNVIRNDVVLTHYESLSRGDDNIDDAKKERLAKERAVLYERHPSYYDQDPYYHPMLTGASERYETSVPLENKNLPVVKHLATCKVRLNEKEINETLILKRDHLDKCFYADEGRKTAYLIDLHAHVRGLDSCDYRYHMYLRAANGSVYDVPAIRRYRPDVEKTYYDQIHVELSGFAIKIAEGALPAGSYEVWMEAKSALSRQRLINRLSTTLRIEG